MKRLFLTSFSLVFAALCLQAVEAREVKPTERVTTAVIVRQGPSTNTAVLSRLRPGEAAEVIDEVPGWYHVRLADGTDGYVSKTWTNEVAEAGAGESLVQPSNYKIHVIDVGTGLAVFVESKNFALLYDAGSQDDLHDGDENRVVAYIHAVRPDLRRLDHVILSHPHKDHVQLMPDVFRVFDVKNVWDSGRVNNTDGYCHFLKAIAGEPGVTYHDAIASNQTRSVSFSGSGCSGTVVLHEGEKMTAAPVALGIGASMSMLWRNASNFADPNGNSIVVRLDLGGNRVLLAGDAEGGERKSPSTPPDANSIEGTLLGCCRAELKADALVVGHHGSLTSSRNAFIDAVGARIFVISSGPHPYRSVRLPDEEIVQALKQRGEVFRTDIDDDACGANTHKIGPDNDEDPGGCDNVVIRIDGSAISAQYNRSAD
ncbi:SH3 domain-containing protein [Sphingobium sp. Sx8-8]|uniref:MBL fold metallo-hydrolase n=1 Tax=Sphingobium sp. Sx8-8 TaxID=2933617 RepID=UPI001F577E70|nr:SH3 domain-containing protein [Sphingobium sp. Sx8-8]